MPVLAQSTPPAPACAVACVGQVASADMCSGVGDVGCLCAIAAFAQQASNCVQQQCDSGDLQPAADYIQAFCSTGQSLLLVNIYSVSCS
ncbi:hypothetical protein EVG20_g9962 [Dentipellis fragilis]|uniref:CFEM domain-containing protein n=1 Tax=Dentipellis fragilis TaxID=205917 RepID=A0A4Y9XVM1_9AGAM|nr:hypothetical protein EVG20_g9962 [Dentipellis fragilis]